MKVLVIGSGGREHTIAWKLLQSKEVHKIYCAPGNGGTESIAENVNIKDIEELVTFAKEKSIDLTVVGPEDPLVNGIVDRFKEEGLRIFGVDSECAKLEGSKIYSKAFMERHDIPTAKYTVYNDYNIAINDLDNYSYPIVIKADGLCAGKGVVICEDKEMAEETLESFMNQCIFGDAGTELIIEEFLTGIEASLLCFVSNNRIIPMESAKDYKQIFDNDEGPNTGGVGCFSPSPLFTDDLKSRIKCEVLDKIEAGFNKDGLNFNGILFIGFMIDKKIDVLEFNVRFGDPETEVVLPRLQSDLFEILNKTIDGTLEESDLQWTNSKSMTVILASEGYPEKPIVGREIEIEELSNKTILFHNGTKLENNKLFTTGGRVLSVTQLGNDFNEIRNNIYSEIDKINFEGMYYRKDIGKL